MFWGSNSQTKTRPSMSARSLGLPKSSRRQWMCGFLSVSFKVQNQTSYVVCRRKFPQKAIFMSKLDIFYIHFVSKFCYSITMSCPSLSSWGRTKSSQKAVSMSQMHTFRFNVLPFCFFFFPAQNSDPGIVWSVYLLYQKASIQALCSVAFSVRLLGYERSPSSLEWSPSQKLNPPQRWWTWAYVFVFRAFKCSPYRVMFCFSLPLSASRITHSNPLTDVECSLSLSCTKNRLTLLIWSLSLLLQNTGSNWHCFPRCFCLSEL